MQINAILPKKNERSWILISCDAGYFKEHAPSFIYSAEENNHNVHVNVVNPTSESYAIYNLLKNDIKTSLSFSELLIDIKPYQKWDKTRATYASSRFFVAPFILSNSNIESMFISDTDSVVLNNLPKPDHSIGLFIRNDQPREMKIAAGIVYVSGKRGLEYINDVANILYNNEPFWFCDQLALYEMAILPQHIKNVGSLNHSYMDWEFQRRDVCIWTGKGERKHNNMTYKLYKESKNRLKSITERFWL